MFLALILYRPWIELPFDVWDFQEFLPLVQATDSAVDQLATLVDYYGTHGRRNVAFYASLVVQWQLFGLDNSGWQWWRFITMSANLWLLALLLLRLGASVWGSIAGAGLLLASSTVQRSWVQLMAEPQALIAVLTACLLAVEYHGSRRPPLRGALIASLLLLAMLSKEIMVVFCPVVFFLACGRNDAGEWLLPRLTKPAVGLAAMIAAAVAIVALLVLDARANLGALGYGTSYGQGELTVARIVDLFARMTLPHQVAGDLWVAMIYPATLAFLVAVALGLAVMLRQLPRRQVCGSLAFALLIPALGAAVYLPWPKFNSFYGMPFILGSSLILAWGVSAIGREGRLGKALAGMITAVIIGYAMLATDRSLQVSAASLRVNHGLAMKLASLGPQATIAIVGPTEGPRALPVKPHELKSYSAAMGMASLSALPTVHEAPCQALGQILEGALGPMSVISYSYGCGRLKTPSWSTVVVYRYRDWLTLRSREDSVAADLLLRGS